MCEIPPQQPPQLWRPQREGQAHDGFYGRVEAAEPEGRVRVRHGLLAILAVTTHNMLDRLLEGRGRERLERRRGSHAQNPVASPDQARAPLGHATPQLQREQITRALDMPP